MDQMCVNFCLEWFSGKSQPSTRLGRRFHEMKILCGGNNQEPDMFEKVSTFRGHRGTVDLTVVVNRTCRWGDGDGFNSYVVCF